MAVFGNKFNIYVALIAVFFGINPYDLLLLPKGKRFDRMEKWLNQPKVVSTIEVEKYVEN